MYKTKQFRSKTFGSSSPPVTALNDESTLKRNDVVRYSSGMLEFTKLPSESWRPGSEEDEFKTLPSVSRHLISDFLKLTAI